MTPKFERTIVVRKVRAGTIFKLILTGLTASALPLGLFFGVAGALGANTVRINGRPIHGSPALLLGTGLTVVLVPLLGVFLSTAVCFGLWVVSFFRPITVRVVLEPGPRDHEGVEASDLDFNS